MPIPIYTAGAWQRLRDAFDLKGKHNLLLDEVVVPVALVADLSSEATHQANDATAQASVPAEAGETGTALFANIGDTGVDLLVDRIVINCGTSGRFRITSSSNAPLAPIAASSLVVVWNNPDQPGSPPGQIFADEGAFIGDRLYDFQHLASTSWYIEPKWVLPPNSGLAINFTTVNILFQVTFQYRVRTRN